MPTGITEGGPTLSKNCKTESRAPRMSARQYVATGVTGAAMVGIGVLLAAPPGAPTPATMDVKLVNTESALPQSPPDPFWLLDGNGGTPTSSGTPTPSALAAALGGGLRPIVGPGGWLIGDGLDADPGCAAGSA